MAGPELSDLVMDGFGSGRGVGTVLYCYFLLLSPVQLSVARS